MRVWGHGAAVLILTLLTQIGGLAWLLALHTGRRWHFVPLYLLLTLAAHQVAPLFGRAALPCWSQDNLRLQSPLYCALNRNLAAPALIATLQDLADHIAVRHPGTVTLVLDANFPFVDGFPMFPHLSHDDGRKADIAFWYGDASGYQPGRTRSPIGYFAFERGPTDCPPAWPTLRWDLDWLQPLWPKLTLDRARMQTALHWLAADSRVQRVFLEPHLRQSLGVSGPNFGFQGCRAARHDDHIHVQSAQG
jgi:hypothetical protein